MLMQSEARLRNGVVMVRWAMAAPLGMDDLDFLDDWHPDSPAGKRAFEAEAEAAALVTPPLKRAKAGGAVLVEPPERAAGFIVSLYTLLNVCDPAVVQWSEKSARQLRSTALDKPQFC